MNKDEAEAQLRVTLTVEEIVTALADWKFDSSSDANLLKTLREYIQAASQV